MALSGSFDSRRWRFASLAAASSASVEYVTK